MKEIFDVYKNKLDDFIVSLKAKVKQQPLTSQLLEEIRNEINQWGKNNLNLMFLELKSLIDSKQIDEYKKKTILERAQSLTEYGLYVAPIDLIQQEDTNSKSIYIAGATLLGASILQKLLFKKFKFVNSALLATIAYLVSKSYFSDNQNNTDVVLSYIDDAKEWLSAAFDNIYKTFEELA
ncbi:MAG: hypothetical protein ACPLW6_01800 [Desulfurella sp.]|jgi:hypothetical protein|uniref:Uncharacterized protein n=1 Tax=Desulfurella multipotens TaxID=79269 RepID=A0A1G6KT90_9BACT|nr:MULTISPECIES: hypothetical protein [Desulfurella]AHF97748.1 hypothetical protein DESACE_02330 [Desulfurella acetivorans A63]HEX13596.1 hypothetical protein [Desulfurella acetivorans]PMP62963.1 MAG: hypothetical protein C0192_08270 [Desulfurella multipotens]PMP87437.1 MAG: hypothetical protein C0173_09155 [Desulfurella sp.]SDC34001.1 hypothetical protein SAMN05660835_00680 [Desulfurella multipotens]